MPIDFKSCREEIAGALQEFCNRWCKREHVESNALVSRKLNIFKIIDGRISFYCNNLDLLLPKIVSIIRKYHNHKPQTTPWHREEEPLNHHETPGRQMKQSNQLSLPHQDDCNTRMDIK